MLTGSHVMLMAIPYLLHHMNMIIIIREHTVKEWCWKKLGVGTRAPDLHRPPVCRVSCYVTVFMSTLQCQY